MHVEIDYVRVTNHALDNYDNQKPFYVEINYVRVTNHAHDNYDNQKPSYACRDRLCQRGQPNHQL